MPNDLLHDVHSRLRYMQARGIDYLPAVAPPAAKKHPMSPALEAIRTEIGDCTRCGLCQGRSNIVFGVGNPHADLMFIGEGPGADEDRLGEPFVGRAGKLLDKIIAAMGMRREDVYINNIVMCRPPKNRAPLPSEADACMPFLLKRIEAVKPKIIVCLGSSAAKYLLGDEKLKITQERGTFRQWHGYQLMPTYHPAFLLRNPHMKKPVWEDMQQVMKALEQPMPSSS